MHSLIFLLDESCSTTTDGESVGLDFNAGGSGLESVATWAQSPRDNCAPHPIYYFTDGSLELQVSIHSLLALVKLKRAC